MTTLLPRDTTCRDQSTSLSIHERQPPTARMKSKSSTHEVYKLSAQSQCLQPKSTTGSMPAWALFSVRFLTNWRWRWTSATTVELLSSEKVWLIILSTHTHLSRPAATSFCSFSCLHAAVWFCYGWMMHVLHVLINTNASFHCVSKSGYT